MNWYHLVEQIISFLIFMTLFYLLGYYSGRPDSKKQDKNKKAD